MEKVTKNGIPVVYPPRPPRPCRNPHTGRRKIEFESQFVAERYLRERVNNKRVREALHPYKCPEGNHWHLTSQKENTQ